ncbi:tyrosine-protein phosphatase [Microbulbifer pacificus]|uniref:Tyrosine-protein phosphatase n=1 Tax=Microbulbifer pacificus TaxID=407164 RepID=A0AAU0MX22_9GAMM|nr:tyrosine-protein phosphatase [Microbulbifer pacificus]WOX04591.1 tyrosine-protein phosphatase [Microbulbifer pacificus]
MKKVFTNGILAAAVVLTLGACSATAPIAGKTQSAAVQSDVEHVRLLPLEGGRNFRDIGGYKTVDGKEVKWGKIYRSGVLIHLTENDYEYLKDREIATIVDFRSTEERSEEPDNWRSGEVTTLAWDYELGNFEEEFTKVIATPGVVKNDLVQVGNRAYIDLVRQQTPAFRAMFQKLIESDEPLLIHCTAGKDRTGIGAALILTALGVDRETVKQDYMLSTEVLKKSNLFQQSDGANEKEDRRQAFFSQLPQEVRDFLMTPDASYVDTAFGEMERQHGSVQGYIEHALDVDHQELALLKARYLQ